MAMLVVLTAVASALLDNVTPVLLVAPVTLLVCDQIDADPVPFLIAEVMASNIGGTATLIGDPPNIIIASKSGLTFNDFVVNLAINDARLLAKSGLVLAGVLVGFVSHSLTGLEPSLVALLGAGALLAVSDLVISDAVADVEWPTLVFSWGSS